MDSWAIMSRQAHVPMDSWAHMPMGSQAHEDGTHGAMGPISSSQSVRLHGPPTPKGAIIPMGPHGFHVASMGRIGSLENQRPDRNEGFP